MAVDWAADNFHECAIGRKTRYPAGRPISAEDQAF
jgi:hypothetical protein